MIQPNQREPWWRAAFWVMLAAICGVDEDMVAYWVVVILVAGCLLWCVAASSTAHGHDCQWSFPRNPVAATLRDKVYSGRFQACMANATVGCCADVYDVDDDGDVDLEDYARYLNCTSEIYEKCPTCSN